MTPNLRFWSVTQTGAAIAKPDTLKKEINFVVFIRNYRVYTSGNGFCRNNSVNRYCRLFKKEIIE